VWIKCFCWMHFYLEIRWFKTWHNFRSVSFLTLLMFCVILPHKYWNLCSLSLKSQFLIIPNLNVKCLDCIIFMPLKTITFALEGNNVKFCCLCCITSSIHRLNRTGDRGHTFRTFQLLLTVFLDTFPTIFISYFVSLYRISAYSVRNIVYMSTFINMTTLQTFEAISNIVYIVEIMLEIFFLSWNSDHRFRMGVLVSFTFLIFSCLEVQ